jgi:cytochrome c biogenesis protein CcmG/thiol:disulfide interchange protein DsbE
MRRGLALALAALVSLSAHAAPAGPAAGVPPSALCRVCQVKHGEAEEEPVRAVRVHAGREYGFCSEKCAREFDADPAAYLPPEFPRATPAFSVTGLDGATISPVTLKGKVALLDFWATWCAPCRKSMPELDALHRRHAASGFTVVGISIDEGGGKAVRKFVSSRRIGYPIALDSETDPAWEAFGVKAVPAAFLLDRQGRIVAQWTGVPADTAALERRLRELLAAD